MYNKRKILIVALLFLSVALIFSSYVRSDVYAKSRVTRGPIECNNLADDELIRCCQTETDSKGVKITYCTVCDNTAPPSNCTPRTEARQIKLPPSDLATTELTPTVSPPKDYPPLTTDNLEKLSTTTLQPKTTSCPDGSAPDAKGNCPTAENKTPPPPSSDNLQLKGGSESNSNNNDNNDNNNPTSDHHHQGNDLGKKVGEQESTTTKKGSNNDNSPTPPP
jgi:hypothetical protein